MQSLKLCEVTRLLSDLWESRRAFHVSIIQYYKGGVA